MSSSPTYAACVDGREEGGWQIADAARLAIERAMEGVVEDTECGWEEPGRWTLEVLSGCLWHERCDDEGCEHCGHCDPIDPEWDYILISHDLPRVRVQVEVYAGEDDVHWRLVPE